MSKLGERAEERPTGARTREQLTVWRDRAYLMGKLQLSRGWFAEVKLQKKQAKL